MSENLFFTRLGHLVTTRALGCVSLDRLDHKRSEMTVPGAPAAALSGLAVHGGKTSRGLRQLGEVPRCVLETSGACILWFQEGG